MQLPLFDTPSGWAPPRLADLPDWSSAKRVGIDIETCDPYLKKLGPSVRRGGFIAGVSFALEDGPSYYLPLRHAGGDNVTSPEEALRYLREQAAQYQGIIVGANFNYDLDYLAEAGITFPNVKFQRDVQIADPLIYELYPRYTLQAIAERWGFPGKDTALLDEACKNYGLKHGEMWKLPARHVGPYAEEDAALPLRILRKQERTIEDKGLWPIYDLESRLQPVLLRMRRRGVRVDLNALEKVRRWAATEEAAALERVRQVTGVRITPEDVWRKEPTVAALKTIGVQLKETASGQPQVDKALLEKLDHDVSRDLLHARKVNKLRTTFAQSILDHLVGDRVHCTFNQLRAARADGEEKGARYGRTSCTDPNLQQQPIRDEFGKMWRSIYVPDEPDQLWASADYSEQEPRMLTHYAETLGLRGAARMGDAYRSNPETSNHTMMSEWTGLPRKQAKNIYLGISYGEGGAKLATNLDLPTKVIKRNGHKRIVAGDEAQRILDLFHEHAPYVAQLSERCQEAADKRGFIMTILGRHCHFPPLEDGSYDWTHKALNRLIQGSCGDQMKKALIEIDAAGLPLQLVVHDEVDASVNSLEEGRAIADIMERCVEISVPSKVDLETGPSWGEIA